MPSRYMPSTINSSEGARTLVKTPAVPTRSAVTPKTVTPKTVTPKTATPKTATPASGPQTLTGAGLAVILVGALLPMVDFFIVNVALPTIDADLRASQPLLELVVSGYATAYALLLVLGGRLGDSVGRKRLFMF